VLVFRIDVVAFYFFYEATGPAYEITIPGKRFYDSHVVWD
jgi:hypothetical protein